MTVRCAETGELPPAFGVRVTEEVAEAGFRTVRTEFSAALITETPVICELSSPVPETV